MKCGRDRNFSALPPPPCLFTSHWSQKAKVAGVRGGQNTGPTVKVAHCPTARLIVWQGAELAMRLCGPRWADALPCRNLGNTKSSSVAPSVAKAGACLRASYCLGSPEMRMVKRCVPTKHRDTYLCTMQALITCCHWPPNWKSHTGSAYKKGSGCV